MLVSDTPTSRGKPSQTTESVQGSKVTLSVQTQRVGEYIIQLLGGEAVSSSQLGRPLTPTAYISLLPTIWALINTVNIDGHQLSGSVLQATLDHAVKASSKSALKRPTIEFVARVILVSISPQRDLPSINW